MNSASRCVAFLGKIRKQKILDNFTHFTSTFFIKDTLEQTV